MFQSCMAKNWHSQEVCYYIGWGSWNVQNNVSFQFHSSQLLIGHPYNMDSRYYFYQRRQPWWSRKDIKMLQQRIPDKFLNWLIKTSSKPGHIDFNGPWSQILGQILQQRSSKARARQSPSQRGRPSASWRRFTRKRAKFGMTATTTTTATTATTSSMAHGCCCCWWWWWGRDPHLFDWNISSDFEV